MVLLAVVLIVALVSVALLGFFPGMASDAQMTQSKTYWQSAQPVAITEWAAMAYSVTTPDYTLPYLRLKNNGAYPIRITKIFGYDSSTYMDLFFNTGLGCASGYMCNYTNYLYLAPGEETYLASLSDGGKSHYSVPVNRYIFVRLTSACSGWQGYGICAASSICGTTPPYGSVVVKNFGFEYIEYIEGQQITKREIGKDLIIKCSQPPA